MTGIRPMVSIRDGKWQFEGASINERFKGTITITAGNTSGVVTHGLNGTPKAVVTPITDNYWGGFRRSVSSTQVTAHIPAPQDFDLEFDVLAEV